MPKYEGFSPVDLKSAKKIVNEAEKALTNAQLAYVENDALFRRNFNTWFGKTTKASIEDVVYTLALMGGEIKHDNFRIELGAPSGSENANVLHFKKKYLHGREPVDQIWRANKEDADAGNPSPMTFRPQMLMMPFIDQTQQSQVETFLHELAHFAAGVIDYNPPSCYDVSGTNYCKLQGVDIAVRNAENVGFFIQSFLFE
jgi:hypothetical protein